MITRSTRNELESIRYVYDRNGDKYGIIISHRNTSEMFSGWFICVTTYDSPEDKIPDWGFCSGWCKSYPEAYTRLKSNVSYKRYPVFDFISAEREGT